MNKLKLFFSSVWYICFVFLYAQGAQNDIIVDSLARKNYEELESDFNTFRYDTIRAQVYAKAYLDKGKLNNDVIKQADAYVFFSSISKPLISEKYADSIIFITRNLEDYTYPAKGFITKAYALRLMGKYKEALNQYLKANDYAIRNHNTSQQLYIKYQIGILKNDIGEYGEALKAFKEYVQEAEKMYKEDKKKHVYTYTRALYGLGDSYNRNKLYDSATAILQKGLAISLRDKNALNPAYFNMSNGITECFKQNYPSGIEILKKASQEMLEIQDTGNMMVCYIFIGNAYKYMGTNAEAIRYFKKVDSMVKETSDIFPGVRSAYEFLIDYYKEEHDTENQLRYIKDLLHIDSVLLNNYKHMSKNISQKYDTPQLLVEKDKLIDTLEDKHKASKIGIALLLGSVLISSVFAFNYYRKQHIYRKKFEALLTGKPSIKSKSEIFASNDMEVPNIPETTLNNIREQLEQFVNKKQFLRNDISLNGLAKSMETNAKYLALAIKYYEQKNFISYLHDLRMDYVIEELKNNVSFRKYSIKAIAEEIGFNNPQSFSRLFHKKTGIYPSYFIREIEKEELKEE